MRAPGATEWKRECCWVLGRTGLEIHRENGSELWFVVNASDFDEALTEALPFEQAMAFAERLARQYRPDLYRTDPIPKQEPDE